MSVFTYMWQPQVEAKHSSVAYSDHVFMFELLILWLLFEGDYSRVVTILGGGGGGGGII